MASSFFKGETTAWGRIQDLGLWVLGFRVFRPQGLRVQQGLNRVPGRGNDYSLWVGAEVQTIQTIPVGICREYAEIILGVMF